MRSKSIYWNGPRDTHHAPTVQAERIPKNQWMDAYFHLYRQCYGDENAIPSTVIADARHRINLIYLNGLYPKRSELTKGSAT